MAKLINLPTRLVPEGENNDRLLSDQQVAELAIVSINTVRYWRQIGKLPFVKVGKHPQVWLSVFNKVFGKPVFQGGVNSDNMKPVQDIRRISNG